MIIAVDFDGTIVEHRYPEIGREKPFAFDTLKMLQYELSGGTGGASAFLAEAEGGCVH